MNKTFLIGRLTKDVELRKNESGSVVGMFTLAVNRIGAKENQQQADFINCRVWNNQAENLAHYQGKGSKVAVEGSTRTDVYEDSEGNKRYSTYVLVQQIEYLTNKGEQKQEESKEEPDFEESFKVADLTLTDDDLPF